jgi:glycosyltransferase involved in cell wall biosynthesis
MLPLNRSAYLKDGVWNAVFSARTSWVEKDNFAHGWIKVVNHDFIPDRSLTQYRSQRSFGNHKGIAIFNDLAGMTIIHFSYVRIEDHHNPDEWLKRINFYTGIPEAMSERHTIHSIHCINHSGVLRRNDVDYHFVKITKWQHLFPFQLNRYVKKLLPDVIILHGLHFSWQILLLRIQLGRNIKLFAQHHAEQPLRLHRKFLQRLNDRFISGYFFTSDKQAEHWLKKKQIKSASKVHEIMEASSVFYPIPKAIARAHTLIRSSPAYLWVGRLDTNKDPLTLAKAFVNFLTTAPQARLYVIYQQDDLLDDVKKITDEYPENIFLIGKISHSELLYWFNSADFIISTSHYEGSGIAVCEAMSCGCIPVLTDIPSFRMMTGEGRCGLLFSPGDTRSLAEALIKSQKLNIEDMRKEVLDYFSANLSFKAIADRMTEVLNS